MCPYSHMTYCDVSILTHCLLWCVHTHTLPTVMCPYSHMAYCDVSILTLGLLGCVHTHSCPYECPWVRVTIFKCLCNDKSADQWLISYSPTTFQSSFAVVLVHNRRFFIWFSVCIYSKSFYCIKHYCKSQKEQNSGRTHYQQTELIFYFLVHV